VAKRLSYIEDAQCLKFKIIFKNHQEVLQSVTESDESGVKESFITSIFITANTKLVTEGQFIRKGPSKTVKNNLTSEKKKCARI
jgi:hypothetical protein